MDEYRPNQDCVYIQNAFSIPKMNCDLFDQLKLPISLHTLTNYYELDDAYNIVVETTISVQEPRLIFNYI